MQRTVHVSSGALTTPEQNVLDRHFAESCHLHSETGQLFLSGPLLDLQVPVIIVRHGQTDGNVTRVMQGQVDAPENQLNAVGRQQSEVAAAHLYDTLRETFDDALPGVAAAGKIVLLSSPFTRARDTAQKFVEYFFTKTGIQLPLTLESDLAEMSFGDADGFRFEEMESDAVRASVLRYRVHQDATTNWNGTGESFLDVLQRAKGLLDRLNAHYGRDGALVITFSHGILSSALRTLVADPSILDDTKMVAFRNNCLNNAEPYWLGPSRRLLAELQQSLAVSC